MARYKANSRLYLKDKKWYIFLVRYYDGKEKIVIDFDWEALVPGWLNVEIVGCKPVETHGSSESSFLTVTCLAYVALTRKAVSLECIRHRIENVEWDPERRYLKVWIAGGAAERALSLCVHCSNPAMPGTHYCKAHIDRAKEEDYDFYRRPGG